MARGLDGLQNHVLDQIALCGKRGASPSDFIAYVKDYYANQPHDIEPENDDHAVSHSPSITPNVDRSFLEQSWKWLTKHPDIRVGNYSGHRQLSLSEVESRNSAFQHVQQDAASSQASSALVDTQGGHATQDKGVAESPDAPKKGPAALDGSDYGASIRLYASEGRMWYALAGHGPDLNKIKGMDFDCLSIIAASGPNGIYQHDLIKSSGQDKRSLPARTDRLHEAGYIEKKRLTIQLCKPKKMLHTSLCTMKRFVKNVPDQALQLQSGAEIIIPETRDAIEERSDSNQDGQKHKQSPSPAAGEIQHKHTSQSNPRTVPQWTVDKPINNQIFELVDRSGIQGMSMNEIRETLMGEHFKKPIEDYISRLVERWQLSQPLHLRYLSIVRDTVLKGKSQIYIYYTYNNFKKLVESGKGFWEAVTTVPKGVSEGRNTVAALDAEPDVEDYGFPTLDLDDFHGHYNDATPSECASALYSASKDPVRKRRIDGAHGARRKVHKPSFVEEPSGHQPNTTAPLCTTAMPTIPPVAEPRKLKPRSTDPQTMNQKPKYSRQPGSKPRGRPRKYPKTGTPADTHNSTPHELRLLKTSQEAAEAYERTKVEKEISRRIEDGNDPFLVTREVLAETDALRMREGEQRLSQASRAQILHEFAGGPKPEPERSAARPVSKPVGRPRKQISYWPSIGAHTFALPAPRDSKNDKPEAAKIASTRARGRRRPLPNKQPLMYHLPSVAAHSWPVAYELSSTLKASQRGEKRARGRLPKQTKPETPPPKYLPSVAAHSRPLLPLDVSPTVRSPREAKEPLSMPLQYDNNPSRQHSAYTATTASYNAPATGTSVGTAYSKVDIGNQSTYPGWELFMSKYYVQQLQTIVRYGSGIFLGVTTNRRKRPCEPRGFRPTVFKLLVFKLPRLKDFPWFLAESVTPEQPHDREKGSQMPKLQIADPKAISPTASLILSHDHRSASTSRDSIAFTDTAVQPVSNHFSPSAAITGKKRKRGTSPQPTRGAALFDPFIRSSHINYPLPQTGPFSASNTPISTSEMAHPSPANDDAGETTKNDEVTGHTPAKQRSARLPSSSPLGASVMEEEQPVSERLTIPCLSPRSTIALIPEASTTDELRAIDHPPIHTSRSFLDFPSVLVPVPSPTDKQLATGGRTTTPSRTSQQSPQSPIPDAYAGDDLLVSKANESPSRTPQPSQYHGQHAKQSRSNTSTIKMSRQGGSAAILRKNIIMGIIDKCEGVFPSYKEMVLPFAAEWKLRGQEGTPEQKTISNAVDSLCKEGKLRQIVFTAQTKYGVAMTKGMLLSASIDATDPKVKEMQAKMVAHHPRYYVPEAVMPSQDPPEGALDRAAERVKKMMDGKAKAAANRLTTLKAQERREAGHADGLDVSSQHWTILSSMYAHSTPITRLPYISRKSFPKRPGGRRGMKRRVERLASLRKPLPARRVPPPLPIPAASLNPLRNPGSLLWLPLDYSFSDYNFEDERPTVLGESSEIGSDHRRAPPDFHVGTFQAPNPLSSSEQAKQRMRMITENAARIERNQKLAKSKKPSLIYPDYDPSHFKSPYAPIRPPSPPKTLRPADALLLPPRPTSHPYPDTPPYPENSTWGETSLLVDVSGHEMPSMAQNKRYSSPPDTVQHRSLKSRRATEPSSPNSPQSVPPGSSITSRADSFGTQYRRALLVDFMDPTHCFHGATGTFSVTFSGILPPRKPRGHNRVDSHGNVLGFKPDQYDLAWANLQKQWQAVEKAPLERQADFLLSWELNTTDLPNVAFKNWPFVNHVFPHFHQTAQAVEADVNGVKEVTFRPRDGRLMNRRFAIPKSIRAKTGDSILSTGTRALPPSTAELGGRHQGKPSLKRRRLTSLVESRVQDGTSEPLQLDPASRPAKSRRIRGPRDATALGENDEERLLTAVMVVRALTGGLEKRIDWVLVAKVFESTHTQVFLHSRWNHIREKYKLVLPRMEAKFQDIFANAYEEGTVPTLNYENLADYDWNWLVEWTVANIDTPIQSLPGLPAERSQLDDLYTLDETTDNDINTYYEIDGPLASGIRTKVINRDPYVCPLFQKRPTKRAGDLEDLATAKSWVRANIITPESTYNPPVARAKLSTFSEQVVEEALKQLLVDKVLAQENKGRLIPGRNYDVSEYFISRLRKNLQPIHYQRATAYKRQLDQIFAEDGCAKYSITADDGDMLAILNLIAHKRIVAVPVDVPMNKWGQTDGGYETRQMDKRRLNFSVELRPLPTYVQGNPLFPLPPPPCQHLQDLRAKIPLWYDIHGLLVGVMWDLALSAVLTVLTIRPGVGPAELEKVVRPAMEVWEVEMVLDWLVMAKAATKVGSGYMVEEWWWLALDHNAGGCNISRESEERGKERTSEEGQDF